MSKRSRMRAMARGELFLSISDRLSKNGCPFTEQARIFGCTEENMFYFSIIAERMCRTEMVLVLLDPVRFIDYGEFNAMFVEEFAENGMPQVPVKYCGLPTRIRNTLFRNRIEKLGDLAALTKEEVLHLRGIGEAAYAEILAVLHTYNLTLRAEDDT